MQTPNRANGSISHVSCSKRPKGQFLIFLESSINIVGVAFSQRFALSLNQFAISIGVGSIIFPEVPHIKEAEIARGY